MGPIWGRQDPGWPHELCYLGNAVTTALLKASFVQRMFISMNCDSVFIEAEIDGLVQVRGNSTANALELVAEIMAWHAWNR